MKGTRRKRREEREEKEGKRRINTEKKTRTQQRTENKAKEGQVRQARNEKERRKEIIIKKKGNREAIPRNKEVVEHTHLDRHGRGHGPWIELLHTDQTKTNRTSSQLCQK